MKKIIALLMLLVSLATANAKCDWSKVKLVKSNTCNVYKFEVTGISDTCFRGNWFVWKKGTFGTQPPDSSRTYSHTFKDTGYYYVRVSVINACCKGDTTILISFYVDCKPKCDWSKVKLVKSNICNVYKFEVTGTADTCNKHSILIIKKGSTTASYTGDNRVFNYTFSDTGYYFVKVSIKNKCCGGDTLFYDYIHVTCKPTTSKCNWSSLRLQQWNNRNVYKWYVSGRALDDTCVDWMFMIYDFQTKKTDTVWDNKGICEVQFNKKGKYKMYLKVWNRCQKCDTALYREVNIIYFPKCTFTYGMRSTRGNNCADSIIGEMSLGPWTKGDTCWQWWSYIYNSKELNDLSQSDWDSMSSERLYNYYDFNDTGMIFYQGPANSARRIEYKFPRDGKYLVVTQWYNKCLSQDTFFFTRITVNCNKVTGVETIIKGEPKLIGMYDMMGRPIKDIKEGIPYIEIYDNGERRKLMKH